jgi:predicted lysophospholipase L1 biosynthesis ABC-type transport system permease subunit
VLVFAASLSHLVATPRLSGWTWDLKMDVPTAAGVACADANDHGLARTPGIDAVVAVCPRDIQVDGRPVTVWGIRSLRGTIAPEVVAGRAPRGKGEIALGAVTLHSAGKHIGDTVNVRGERGARDFRIVGRIVLPAIGSPQPLADGGAVVAAGLAPLLSTENENATHFLLARFAPGADRAAIERRVTATAPTERMRSIGGPTTPIEVGRLQQINACPAILALVLATLALLAVGHALVTSVRRRRREIALLKTIGFDRRQVGATVAWQATTLAAVGLVVGIPTGLLAGRAVWRAVADGLGVSTAATWPTLLLVVTGVAALALVNLVAFFPARTAARTRPAVALRSE